MTKQIQKNRYLELDGMPVEATGLRKHFSPMLLTATFGVAALSVNVMDNASHSSENKNYLPFVAIEVAVALAWQRVNRAAKWIIRPHYKEKFVVDTCPTTGQKPIPPSDESYIKRQHGIQGSGMTGLSGFQVAREFAYEGSVIGMSCLTLFTPIIYDSLNDLYRLRKINRQEWTIIPRDEMKQEEKEEVKDTQLYPPPIPSLT